MMFDILTSSKRHQFDPRMKILLAFSFARHPRRFDMPQSPTPWGMTKVTE